MKYIKKIHKYIIGLPDSFFLNLMVASVIMQLMTIILIILK
jgi:hypothetical protein